MIAVLTSYPDSYAMNKIKEQSKQEHHGDEPNHNKIGDKTDRSMTIEYGSRLSIESTQSERKKESTQSGRKSESERKYESVKVKESVG